MVCRRTKVRLFFYTTLIHSIKKGCIPKKQPYKKSYQ